MKLAIRTLIVIGLVFAALLIIDSARAAQNNRKLSGTMPAFGDVISIALPPERQDQQNVRKLKAS